MADKIPKPTIDNPEYLAKIERETLRGRDPEAVQVQNPDERLWIALNSAVPGVEAYRRLTEDDDIESAAEIEGNVP